MKKSILFLVFCLLLIHIDGFSQSSVLKKGKVMSKGFVAEIAFEMFRGHIIIPATVHGHTYRFMFDTGAPNMFVKDLFLDTVPSSSIEMSDTHQQRGNVNIGVIDKITLGGIDFDGYGALEFDFSTPFPFRCYGIMGIIGSNLFRGLAVKIDYGAKKLIVTDRINNLAPKVKPIKMTLEGYQLRPLLHLRLGMGKKYHEKVLFDTGYNAFYGIARHAFEQLKVYDGMYTDVIEMQGRGAVGFYGAGENTVQYYATMSNFSIGKADFKNVMAATSNSSGSMIGTDILKYGNVILDFKNKKFYYEQVQEYIADPSKRPHYIASVENERYVIGFILDDRLKELVAVGDEILKIDDIDISEMNPCDMFMVSSVAQKSICVKSSDGRVIDVYLEK